jgi:hypothetical protein
VARRISLIAKAERPVQMHRSLRLGWRLGQWFDLEFALEPQVCNTGPSKLACVVSGVPPLVGSAVFEAA